MDIITINNSRHISAELNERRRKPKTKYNKKKQHTAQKKYELIIHLLTHDPVTI